jgi:hypothetical protein
MNNLVFAKVDFLASALSIATLCFCTTPSSPAQGSLPVKDWPRVESILSRIQGVSAAVPASDFRGIGVGRIMNQQLRTTACAQKPPSQVS